MLPACYAARPTGAVQTALMQSKIGKTSWRELNMPVRSLGHLNTVYSNSCTTVHQLGSATRSSLTWSELSTAMDEFNSVASVSVRTDFLSVPPYQMVLADHEAELADSLSLIAPPNTKLLSNIRAYYPWERKTALEPPHVYVDFLATGSIRVNYIERIIWELARTLDEPNIWPLSEADDLYMLEKVDLGFVYSQLLSRAFSLSFSGRQVTLKPWATSKLKPALAGFGDPPVWIANWDLSDSYIRSYQLRNEYNRKYSGSQPRQSHLVLTASIQVSEEGNVVGEFDGGVVRIRSRTGQITSYGLETKSKSTSGKALSALNRRVKRIGLASASAHSLGGKPAYCEIMLGS